MKTKLLTIIGLGTLALTSCTKYPPDTERITEDLAVFTQVDLTANFNNYSTFSINPTVTYIDGNDTTTLNNENTTALLDRIALDMKNKGFTEVAVSAKPDLGFQVTVIKSTTTTVYYPYYPPYWGYPYYGYGYPYYPTYISSYSTGSVIIDLADFKNPQPNNKFLIIWNAFIRGLITNTHTQNDVLTCVDQAFTQTPSLIKTN
jgi:hypothetical protein